MQIQGRLFIRVVKALPRHDDPAVHLILRIQEMHITGGHHRLVELLSQRNNPPVDIPDILLGLDIPELLRLDHERVVPHRLNLQIIIEIHQSGDLDIRLPVQERPVQLPRLAGAAQDQPFPVLFHEALGYPWHLLKIGQMGLADQPIQVDAAQVIFRQNDGMISKQLLNKIHAVFSHIIQGGKRCNLMLVRQHFDKFNKNVRCALRVIHRPVMALQHHIQRLRHRIQRMLRLIWQ